MTNKQFLVILFSFFFLAEVCVTHLTADKSLMTIKWELKQHVAAAKHVEYFYHLKITQSWCLYKGIPSSDKVR